MKNKEGMNFPEQERTGAFTSVRSREPKSAVAVDFSPTQGETEGKSAPGRMLSPREGDSKPGGKAEALAPRGCGAV
jgi:hypothetical protein